MCIRDRFYAMSPEDAYSLLECIAKISGTEARLKKLTPEGHETLDEEMANEIAREARRGPFRFSKYGIPVGAKIKYINDPSIEVVVVDDRHVSYKGVTTSTDVYKRQDFNIREIAQILDITEGAVQKLSLIHI